MWNYEVVCGVANLSGMTAVTDSNVTTIFETDVDYNVQCAADDTNDALLIQVSAAASKSDNIRWVATIQTTQVGNPQEGPK